jgi:hypothetical protein
LRDGLFEDFFEERHEFVRKPMVNGLLGHVDPQFGGHGLIIAVLGGGSQKDRQNQCSRQGRARELALSLHTTGGASQIVDGCSKHRLHRRRHLSYDSHWEAPSSSLLGCKTRWFKDFPVLLKDQ